MADKVFVAYSPIHGKGVFASAPIPKGERILSIDDSHVVTAENPLRNGESSDHCDYLAGGMVVYLKEPERYINHSCAPNAFCRTMKGVRYLLALRNIVEGEEVTWDYSINGYGDAVWSCTCRSERCRKTRYGDFFCLPLALQLEYLPLLDEWFVEENDAKLATLKQRALQGNKA